MRRLALVPVLLLALLVAAPLASAEEAEETDESALVEGAFEECAEDLFCEEEAEVEEADAEVEETYPPECVLRSAKAHAVLKRDKLKLTIGYTTSEPTKAVLDVHYGATRLAQVKRPLQRSGVLRITKKLKHRRAGNRLPVRVELDPEGTGCPSRRLVLLPR
jgi:hypothetical protein